MSNEPDKARYPEFEPYPTFMSVVFGVFLSVWVQPFPDAFAPPCSSEYNTGDIAVLVRGFVMFGVLISLWWWYAVFFGTRYPAKTFSLFSYDFVSLGVFALGFRFWHASAIFSVLVALGALLVAVRAVITTFSITPDKHDTLALRINITAALILFLCYGIIIVWEFSTTDMTLHAILQKLHPVLLSFAIIATVAAAYSVEGLPWPITQVWGSLSQLIRSTTGGAQDLDASSPTEARSTDRNKTPRSRKSPRSRTPRSDDDEESVP